MANSKKLAANINFVVDNLTTIGVIKEAKAFVKALNKDKATKQYLAEDFVSWIGDELRECEDLIGTNYGYEVVLAEDAPTVLYDAHTPHVYIYAKVFVEKRIVKHCGITTALKSCLEKYGNDNNVFSFYIGRCYYLDIEDGEVNGTTRYYPTY